MAERPHVGEPRLASRPRGEQPDAEGVTIEADDPRATRAAFGLARERPDLSSAPRGAREPASTARVFVLVTLATACLVLAPAAVLTTVATALSCVFLAWIGLRLLASATRDAPCEAPPGSDDALPLYTIVVALYREVAVLPQLVAALDALDYPRHKLQIILVLEHDDHDTRAAVASLALASPYEVIVAPAVGPRTKPKALNVALAFARGVFVGVFDAEDRPEPDQLRRAASAFAQGGDQVACVQARLTIDNTGDGWLTAMFTAEYAGLFDAFLPGLARWRLPLPLGGSSNHFRADILRGAGGWDPFNLTEDADLGMRLARAGYVATVIASSTHEEAPRTLRAWLRQRTRWFQGWIQTWVVHSRDPVRAWRELGPAGFATLQLVVGGTALAALVHPLFVAVLLADIAADVFAEPQGTGVVLSMLFGITTVGGIVSSVALATIGLARRRLLSIAWVVIFVPVYWLLLSLAAWRALVKYFRDPYRWDKTEHGLARTSRLREAADRSQAACSSPPLQPGMVDDAASPPFTPSSPSREAPSAHAQRAFRSRS